MLEGIWEKGEAAMNPIGVIDLISFLTILVALIILWNGWKRAFQRNTKLLFAGLLVFILFYNFCLFLEWSGITKALDTLEDFIGALVPMLWAFVLYAFLQEMAIRDLHQSEKHLRLEAIERKQAEDDLRKHREHLEEMSRHKSQFLANMSHELRTPLNSIIGFTKLIMDGLEGDINEEQGKDLYTVYTSSQHLLELINDLLDLSRIEAGKVVLSYETFTISDLLSEVIPGMEQLAREKGLTLTYSLVPDIGNLYADKAKTKQALINILGNAVKFTDQGSVKIAARVPGDDNLEVRVIDAGVGIKKEDIDKLFLPFQQLDVSLTKKHEGTGLGLHLTKRLVALLRGDISARSEYGRGSEFTFTIPLRYNKEGSKSEEDIDS